MANGNGATNGGVLGKFVESLDNRLVLLLVAAVLGTGGGTLIQKVNPAVRSDPFTGTDARNMEARVMRELDLRLRPHEEHLKTAAKGWEYIYQTRQDVAVMKQQLQKIEERTR